LFCYLEPIAYLAIKELGRRFADLESVLVHAGQGGEAGGDRDIKAFGDVLDRDLDFQGEAASGGGDKTCKIQREGAWSFYSRMLVLPAPDPIRLRGLCLIFQLTNLIKLCRRKGLTF
jgi:hypothetical protein